MTRKTQSPAAVKPAATASRRKFLTAATGVAAGTATLGFPMIAKAQGPISMRWQSTWPSKDIFHEFALDYAKKVNDMTGGDLKIEVLPAGAVVPAFGLLDAVSKGTLDGGHGVLAYHYGKQNALALWGSGPAFGMDGNMMLSWHKYGGGKELLQQALRLHRRERRFVPLWAAPDAAARLVQEADHQGRRLQGHEVPHRGHFDRPVHRHGRGGERAARRRDRPGDWIAGLLDGAEFNNASSDRLLGFPDVSKVCMLQSFHQNAEQFEVIFNKTKYDALPEKIRVHLAYAADAASADMTWKAIDRYSKDYVELQTKDKVKFYKTPDAILQKQLEIFDPVMDKRKDNALFVEIIESQKEFAERAVRWDLDTYVNRRMAYNYYFGKPAAPAKKA